MDAAVTYEPWLSQAAVRGDGKIIFTTKDTNLIADVILTRQKVIETRRADLQAYLRAVSKAVNLLDAGNLEAIRIVAVKLGLPIEEAKKQLAGVKIFNLQSNKDFSFNPSFPNSIIKNFELNIRTAYDTKLIPELLDASSLYNDSIVKSL